MEGEAELPSQYSLKDWLADYQWFAAESQHPQYSQSGIAWEIFENYFQSGRPDEATARYCLDRFVAAMTYLDAHRLAIDFGKAGVVGKEKMMVNRAVIIALYRMYAARTDAELDDEIPEDVFQDIIKQQL